MPARRLLTGHLGTGIVRWPTSVRVLRALCLASGLWLPGASAARAESSPVPPTFAETSCDLPGVSPEIRPRLRCGTVGVPRRYNRPAGGELQLAIVVVRSVRQPALPDPVLYISGGPGSPLTIYTEYQARHPYAPDRDLVLVDQRGTGRSEPSLCPELAAEFVNAMLSVVTDPTPEALSGSRAVHAACHASIVARGIDPNGFGTLTTVEDYERVRRALGVARWNVVGESYGTTVAMTLMARHPDTVRSAVLDSLNPPDATFTASWSTRMAEAREAFFAACAADTACSATYPDLAGTYRATVRRLGGSTPSVALPPALGVPGDGVRLTSSLFEEVVGRLVYYPPGYPGLPRLIATVHDGDTAPFGTALAALLAGAGRDGNEAAFTAVECRERPHWREPAREGASPLDLALLPPGVCIGWSDLGPEPEIPRDTLIPTLVLAGQFDPNIGPALSRHVADLIGPRARWLRFAGIGHNVRHFSPCATDIVAAFIGDPAGELDTACADRAPTISFQPRR